MLLVASRSSDAIETFSPSIRRFFWGERVRCFNLGGQSYHVIGTIQELLVIDTATHNQGCFIRFPEGSFRYSRSTLAYAIPITQIRQHLLILWRFHTLLLLLLAIPHRLHSTLHQVYMLRYLGKLISKLICVHFDTARVPPWHRYRRLEMCLLMDIFHHWTGFEEVVGLLEFGGTAFGRLVYWSICLSASFLGHLDWLSHGCGVFSGHDWIVLESIISTHCYFKLTCTIVLSDAFLKIMLIDFIFSKECLRLVFQRLHKPFGLKVWIEAHRRPYLLGFLSRPHLPHSPLRLRRCAVNEAITFECCLDPFFIRAHGAETHARRANHLSIMVLLGKTPPVVVSLCHGFYGHLGKNIEQGLISITQYLSGEIPIWGTKLSDEISVTNLIGFLIDLHLG